MKIIFAQGNPEPDYANTRHNVGCMVLNNIVKNNNLKWTDKPKFNVQIAEYNIEGEKILLVKPACFYNVVGISVRALMDFYKVDVTSELLVVRDDLAIPFGTIRVREDGSDGGNNGAKSINEHIGFVHSRIRIGTNNDLRSIMKNDAAFVLAKFSADENKLLCDKIIPQAIELIDKFCAGNLENTSHKILDK